MGSRVRSQGRRQEAVSGARPALAGWLALTLALAVLAAMPSGGRAAGLGQFTELATPTAASGPDGIAAGPDGNLWFAEYAADKIAEIDPTTHAITEFALPTAAAGPADVTVGPDGNVWFTEFLAGKIGVLNPSTHAITEFATPTAGSGPLALVSGPDGNVWFTESGADRIGEINPTSHAIAEYPVPTAGAKPYGITVGSDGNIWFTEKSANKLGELSTTDPGEIFEYAIPTAASEPNAIAAGPDGSLWFTQSAAGVSEVGVLSPSSPGAIQEIALPDPLAEPLEIVTGPDGNMWFTEGGDSAIGVIDSVTHAVTGTFATPTAASSPLGIAVGPDGNLWYTEGAQAKVGQVGSGAAAALTAPPSITGAVQPGSAVSCADTAFANWWDAPSPAAYPFDGYRWLLGGTPVAGATAQTFTPQSNNVGLQLTCQVTATYPLQGTTVMTASSPVTISPSLGAALIKTVVSSQSVAVTIDCAGAPGQSCSGPLTLVSQVTERGKSAIALAAAAGRSRAAKAKTQAVTETVGAGAYALAAGASGTFEVVLSHGGESLLGTFYSLPTTLVIGGTTPLRQAVTFSDPMIAATVSYAWSYSSAYSSAGRLVVSKVPPDGTVTTLCRGGGCPFKRRRVRPVRDGASLTASLAHRRLLPGAIVTVEVTAGGRVGKVVQFTVRRSAPPAVASLCLAPGASAPARCRRAG